MINLIIPIWQWIMETRPWQHIRVEGGRICIN